MPNTIADTKSNFKTHTKPNSARVQQQQQQQKQGTSRAARAAQVMVGPSSIQAAVLV
jgi:hypothetical protein